MKCFHNTNHFLILILFGLPPAWIHSENHILSGLKQNGVNILHSEDYTYAPGDTFIINDDSIAGLRLLDFKGSLSQPITFINGNHPVKISESTYHGIQMDGCEFVILSGEGTHSQSTDPVEYGIHILKATPDKSGMGVVANGLSSDIEIHHIEIENTGFAGIMAKTDPNCEDTTTWRRNGYVFKNLNIHHNYIHDTGGEGMYIGYTGGYKVQSKKICSGDTVFGHWLENVSVQNNKLANLGWDGIQVGLVRKNGIIANNEIEGYGLKMELYQNFGMSIGGGIYQILNNKIQNGSFTQRGVGTLGMQFIDAESGSVIINNLLLYPGGHGIFIHNRHKYDDTTQGYLVAHNTIIQPSESGIFYNAAITVSSNPAEIGDEQSEVPFLAINNLIVEPGNDYASMNFWKDEAEAFLDFNTLFIRNTSLPYLKGNFFSRNISGLKFADAPSSVYKLTSNSTDIIDQGVDLMDWINKDPTQISDPDDKLFRVALSPWEFYLTAPSPIQTDIRNTPRNLQNGVDIGAYEYDESTASLEDKLVNPNRNKTREMKTNSILPELKYNPLGQRITDPQRHFRPFYMP